MLDIVLVMVVVLWVGGRRERESGGWFNSVLENCIFSLESKDIPGSLRF